MRAGLKSPSASEAEMYEQLYEENKTALRAEARRYRGYCEKDRAVSVEDLEQAAFFGLVEAARTFDRDSGKSWPLHVKWKIKKAIEQALGLNKGEMKAAHAGTISLDSPLTEEETDGATLGDKLADDSLPASDEALLLEELQKSVRDALGALNDPRQRQIAELYMIEGHSMREAAERVGIPQARALQLYGRALSNLSRDIRLRALADIDDRTRFYARKGVGAFLSDRTSVVEEAAMWRIKQKEEIARRLAGRGATK